MTHTGVAPSQVKSVIAGLQNAACGGGRVHKGVVRSHDVAKEWQQAGNEACQADQSRPGNQADHGVLEAPHRGLRHINYGS